MIPALTVLALIGLSWLAGAMTVLTLAFWSDRRNQ